MRYHPYLHKFKEGEFNHAWAYEVLAPRFNDLSSDIRELLQLVKNSKEVIESRQNRETLNVPIPKGEIEDRLLAMDSVSLAEAAHVVYFIGHWAYRPSIGKLLTNNGINWKFSNMCDQILNQRAGLNISRKDSSPNGISFKIIEGLLRICISSNQMWSSKEIGLGLVENLNAAKSIVKDTMDEKTGSEWWWDRFETNPELFKHNLQQLKKPWYTDRFKGPWIFSFCDLPEGIQENINNLLSYHGNHSLQNKIAEMFCKDKIEFSKCPISDRTLFHYSLDEMKQAIGKISKKVKQPHSDIDLYHDKKIYVLLRVFNYSWLKSLAPEVLEQLSQGNYDIVLKED